MKKRTAEDFKIKNYEGWYAYIFTSYQNLYLLRDGRVMNWYVGSKKHGIDWINDMAEFSSKKEVQATIKKYLKRLAKRRRIYKSIARPGRI